MNPGIPTLNSSTTFRTGRLSKQGGRDSQQDYCGFAECGAASCWVVADGLGGHKGGELASKIVADTVLASFRQKPQIDPKTLESHLIAAHEAVRAHQKEDATLAQMRSTAVALIGDSNAVLWGHVGDSRLYRFQARGLVALTEDHSVPQALARGGEIPLRQIRGHPDRNRVLRSLGEDGQLRPTVLANAEPLNAEDAFLLCTDGYWEHVLELEMLADLVATNSPEDWLLRGELRILQRAVGAFDNYSAIAVVCTPRRESVAEALMPPFEETKSGSENRRPGWENSGL